MQLILRRIIKGDNQMKEKGIVIISFGTSIERAFETGIKPIEDEIKNTFPEYEYERAYTSNIIRKKLKERDGVEIHNPYEAILSLVRKGCTDIVVQPLHIIPGFEYEKIIQSIKCMDKEFSGVSIKLSLPLLYHTQDYHEVVKALIDRIKDKNIKEEKALILMGHGSEHFANSCYFRLAHYLSEANDNIYLAVVDEDPYFEDIVKKIKHKNIKNVLLKPFMIVAGDHALNDMAGEEEDSWKSILEKEGIKVELCMEGLGSNKEIQEIYINHIKNTLKFI